MTLKPSINIFAVDGSLLILNRIWILNGMRYDTVVIKIKACRALFSFSFFFQTIRNDKLRKPPRCML